MQRRVLRSWKRSTERIAMEKLTSTRKRAKTETRSKPPLTEMLLDKMLTRRMSERTDTRGKKKEKDGHEEANRFSWTRFQSFAALCIGALSTLGRPSPVMFDYPPPPLCRPASFRYHWCQEEASRCSRTRAPPRACSVPLLFPPPRTVAPTPPALLPLSFLRHLNPSVYRVKHLSRPFWITSAMTLRVAKLRGYICIRTEEYHVMNNFSEEKYNIVRIQENVINDVLALLIN